LWHANPKYYDAADILDFPVNKKGNRLCAQDIWVRDNIRKQYLEINGYKVLIIWENEYKQNKEGTIQKCLEFLKE